MPAVMTLERPQWGSPTFRAPQFGDASRFAFKALQQSIRELMSIMLSSSSALARGDISLGTDQAAQFNADVVAIQNLNTDLSDLPFDPTMIKTDFFGANRQLDESNPNTITALNRIGGDFLAIQGRYNSLPFATKSTSDPTVASTTGFLGKLAIFAGIVVVAVSTVMIVKYYTSGEREPRSERPRRPSRRERQAEMNGPKLERPRLKRI